MSVLAVLLLVTSAIVNQTGRVWRSTSAITSAFRESRAAFESITRRLSQATLNPYFDFVNAAGETRAQAGSGFVPSKFERQSELHFVSGQAASLLDGVPGTPGFQRPGHAIFFQAPLGFSDSPPTGSAQLVNLLNATGYYVEYGDDSRWRPDFLSNELNLPTTKRYRLMQMVQGSEGLRIYNNPLTASNRFDWFRQSLTDSQALARPIAENVLTVAFTPLDPGGSGDLLTPDYEYDSKAYLSGGSKIFQNQLPPVVRVTMIAVDDASAAKLEQRYPNGSAPYLQPRAKFTSTAGGQHDVDVKAIEDALTADGINFRVFTTSVVIRQSKFSQD